ncbi:MAG: 3-dehydroquinate synthase [Beijerinckiaceae bacterium]
MTETPAIETITVALGERSYPILIGRDALEALGTRLAALAPGGRVAIVTDAHVEGVLRGRVEKALAGQSLAGHWCVVPPGEATKSYPYFAQVCDAIIAARVERGDLVVALGGGVVGDLTGFAAASVRRGVRFVQIPTTLLSQVDSSVGGKTGINSPHGKNLVGAFYQPALVICDTGVLDSLPRREFLAGYAEVVKYGLINDADFFDWLEVHAQDIFDGGPAREHAVAVSCRAKAAIVARDEKEEGDRALLNLGHTFAHAFERLTGYDTARLVHGEAVAIGLALAFRFSKALGHAGGQDVTRVERHLQALKMPTRIQDIPGADFSAAAILDAMMQDKKVSRGSLTFILARGIGQSFIAKGVPADAVQDFLRGELVV